MKEETEKTHKRNHNMEDVAPKQKPSKPSQIKQLPTKDGPGLGAWACHQIPRVVNSRLFLIQHTMYSILA